MIKELNMSLESGIIQDVTYGEFYKNDIVELSISFTILDVVKINKINSRIVNIHDDVYEVYGRIIYKKDEIMIGDFGILMYSLIRTHEVSLGDYIKAKVYLGVDWGPDVKSDSKCEKFRPLVYTWEIRNIYKVKNHDMYMYNKDDKFDLIEIKRTHSWDDDNGNAYYIFNCLKKDIKPKYYSKTAIHHN